MKKKIVNFLRIDKWKWDLYGTQHVDACGNGQMCSALLLLLLLLPVVCIL